MAEGSLDETDGSQSWDPWAEFIKNGDFRRMNGDLAGALENYRLSLTEAEKKRKKAWNTSFQPKRQAESHARIGDILCEQGSLKAARDSYQAAVSILEQLPPEDLEDGDFDKKLVWTRVKLGDVQMALGDRQAALTTWRGGADAEKEWVQYFDKSASDYNETEPFDPEELRRLADKNSWDHEDLRRMMWLINRAGAERDGSFRHLLDQDKLRADSPVDLALVSYDYSVNGNPKALDHLLTRLARETVGSDSSVVLALSFIDEWDRSVKAVDIHFTATDGAGGSGMHAFWDTRAYLFPRGMLEYQGKAGEGAPVSKSQPVVITIAAAGTVSLNGSPCALDDLENRLRGLGRKIPASVEVRSAETAESDVIAKVTDACMIAGFTDIRFSVAGTDKPER